MNTYQAFNSNDLYASDLIQSDSSTATRHQVDVFQSASDTIGSTWEFLFGGQDRVPAMDLPVMQADLGFFAKSGHNQLNITWLGHSSTMINIDGYRILTDPVFENRVSIVGPSRINGKVPIDIDKLTGIDVVIISHDHYDHLNKFSIRHLKNKTRWFIVPKGVDTRLVKWGVAPAKIRALDWFESHTIGDLTITATPAQHFSGRGLFDRNKTLWASWVIAGSNHKLFFSGDSGYFPGFKKIGDQFGPFDMTLLECGAYNPAWHNVHMFPEETLAAHLDLKGNILMPIHWATFNLSIHSWYDPIVRLTKAAQNNHVRLATPVVGETTRFDNHIPDTKWWEPLIKAKIDTPPYRLAQKNL